MSSSCREGHTGPGERARAVRSAPVVRFAPTPPNSDRSNPHSHPTIAVQAGTTVQAAAGVEVPVAWSANSSGRAEGGRMNGSRRSSCSDSSARLSTCSRQQRWPSARTRDSVSGAPTRGAGALAPLAQPSMMPLSSMHEAPTPQSTPTLHSPRHRFATFSYNSTIFNTKACEEIEGKYGTLLLWPIKQR